MESGWQQRSVDCTEHRPVVDRINNFWTATKREFTSQPEIHVGPCYEVELTNTRQWPGDKGLRWFALMRVLEALTNKDAGFAAGLFQGREEITLDIPRLMVTYYIPIGSGSILPAKLDRVFNTLFDFTTACVHFVSTASRMWLFATAILQDSVERIASGMRELYELSPSPPYSLCDPVEVAPRSPLLIDQAFTGQVLAEEEVGYDAQEHLVV